MESLKYLIHRDFFEEGNAENLQDFAETSVDFQFLFACNLMELTPHQALLDSTRTCYTTS